MENNIQLSDLSVFKGKPPAVQIHGAWIDKFKHLPSGYEIKDTLDIHEDLIHAQSNVTPVVVKASTDQITNVLVEQVEGKEKFSIEDETGEHLYLRVSKLLGTLIFIPTKLQVFHETNEEGIMQVSNTYWEAEANATFLPSVSVEEYYENIDEYKDLKLKLRLHLASSNGKITIKDVTNPL
jgi:hypothetical protein